MGLFRATVRCSFPIGSGGGTNTWHLRTISDEGTTTEVAALMGIVEDFYQALLGSFADTYTWSWDGLVTAVGSTPDNLLAQATPWTVDGVNGSAYAAAPAMACVTWRSSLNTRRGRGRTFLGPLIPTVVESDGTLSSSFLTTVSGAASALVSASLSDTNGALVVWSEADQVGRDFVGSTVTDQTAVLRSRR